MTNLNPHILQDCIRGHPAARAGDLWRVPRPPDHTCGGAPGGQEGRVTTGAAGQGQVRALRTGQQNYSHLGLFADQ